MKFEFAGQSAVDGDNRAANTSRLINCYRESVGDGQVVLKSALGMTSARDVTSDAMANPKYTPAETRTIRALAFTRSLIADTWVILDNTLWGATLRAGWSNFGTVASGFNAGISANNGTLGIVAGEKYYTYTTGSGTGLTQPATGAFSKFGSIDFLGQLTILTESDGRRIQWSDLADATTLGGLNFATAESTDDNIVRGITLGSRYVVFKETVIETWYQQGDGLVPMAGSTIETGLLAHDLVTKFPNGLFFVGDDSVAYIMGAGGVQRVSNTAVEGSIARDTLDTVFYFEDEGHKFCVIRFTDRPAWVYDITTQDWWERAEGVDKPWRVRFATQDTVGTDLTVMGGDFDYIFTLERTNSDFEFPLIRTAISRTFVQEGKLFRIPQVELMGRVGYGAKNPQIVMEMSSDGGASWRFQRQQGFGLTGDHEKRIVFRALGQYRRATMKLTVSDPEEVTINTVAFV